MRRNAPTISPNLSLELRNLASVEMSLKFLAQLLEMAFQEAFILAHKAEPTASDLERLHSNKGDELTGVPGNLARQFQLQEHRDDDRGFGPPLSRISVSRSTGAGLNKAAIRDLSGLARLALDGKSLK